MLLRTSETFLKLASACAIDLPVITSVFDWFDEVWLPFRQVYDDKSIER